jgi:hypothetical protein
MGQDMQLVVVSLTLGVVVFWLIARWYVMPSLEARPRADALIPLVLPHAFRYIGLAFLIPGVVAADINPDFAVPAAYGDLLASILALLAAVALRLRLPAAIPLVWIFNLEGMLDALYAVLQGLRYVNAGQLGGVILIPLLIVPALVVTHVLIFQLLLRKEPSQ